LSKEVIILISAWILTTLVLVLFVPKNKIRHAILIFFSKQFMTWLFGLTVAHYRLIEYPVRSFSNATKSSFDFEYYIYPAICVIFNLYYPEGKGKVGQFLHFFYFCTFMTIFEVLAEEYTKLILYVNWHWSLTWITFFITFYLSRTFYVWYFRLKRQ